jgi:hypothetical protein
MVARGMFAKYAVGSSERSFYKGIPIKDLDVFRYVHEQVGIFFRIRYRGPRDTKRSGHRSNCLKTEATSFAAYRY